MIIRKRELEEILIKIDLLEEQVWEYEKRISKLEKARKK